MAESLSDPGGMASPDGAQTTPPQPGIFRARTPLSAGAALLSPQSPSQQHPLSCVWFAAWCVVRVQRCVWRAGRSRRIVACVPSSCLSSVCSISSVLPSCGRRSGLGRRIVAGVPCVACLVQRRVYGGTVVVWPGMPFPKPMAEYIDLDFLVGGLQHVSLASLIPPSVSSPSSACSTFSASSVFFSCVWRAA